MLGSTIWAADSLLCLSDDLADGAPTKSAGSESKCLEKAIIKLRPCMCCSELLDSAGWNFTCRPREQHIDVFSSRFEEFSFGGSGVEKLSDYTHFSKIIWETLMLAILWIG
jgi:hypothetical protein